MTRSTQFRFSLFKVSFAILAALALALSPQAALAQHGGGGGGHAGGGGHMGSGGGGHASAGFGTAGHSSIGSHVSSFIHVFSGPRSAPAAPAPARAGENSGVTTSQRAGVSAVQRGSSNISVSPSGALPRGTGMFADPRGAAEAPPMHTTIGFPPSTDPRFTSVSSAHGGAPLMFSGQGDQVWQSSISRDAAANRDSARVTETRQPPRTSPQPPHRLRRPPLSSAPFFGSPGFFFGPGFGFFGNGFGCDPFFTPSFGCGFSPFGFGGFGYLGFDGGFGDFGDAGFGYGYDNGYANGYYPPPNYDVTAPNGDEGEWQNPPAANSSENGPSAESPIPVPDTVIYLKDGTSFAVRDYWVADGKLHYVTSYGGQNAVDLSQFDLQRTTDENAAHGISITLRPAPDAQPPAAQPQPPPNPQPPAANPAPQGTPR